MTNIDKNMTRKKLTHPGMEMTPLANIVNDLGTGENQSNIVLGHEKNINTIQSCVKAWLKRNKYIDLKRSTMKLQTKLKN
eukprot:CAMPEP_0170525020 /NCGR_PEP_ID=MMETSP0209-20121228/10475_1 /TAXON_ID=665100 ORGANISM="Litonotus pictus, Strain P1" /NCGR_SAMPLE_ID=MMETSP0209 /ASSEMBLY_ACC=CAM_ASM_000301 /LENGTH=79 /DNA_ID=CAMNT_0010814043 /DNA_START=30 /DNA_END=266 /DNA_ORIENTATION=-